MNVYKNAFEKTVEWINAGLSCGIICGRLPDEGGLSAEISGGETVSEYIDGGAYVRVNMILRAKDIDGEKAFAAAADIAEFIRRGESMPYGIAACGISAPPALENGGGKCAVYRLTAYAEFYTI